MLQVGGVVQLTELDKLLKQLPAEVKNLRPVWRRIDVHLSKLLRDQFKSRGVALGTPWAPISAATQEIRIVRRILSKRGRARARTGAGKDTPLHDSGGLYSSFTKPGAPNSIRVMDALTYARGSSYAPNGVAVARLMQQGFRSTHVPVITKDGDVFFRLRKGGPKKVPARPIIPAIMPAPVLATWEGYLAAYLEGGSGGATAAVPA